MICLALTFACATAHAAESPVTVTLRSDSVTLKPGESTVLHAFAQVSPSFRDRADRIFTWNLDLLVLAPEVATLEANSIVRPRSDLDPVLGSTGTADGPSLLGIRDGFLNLDGAGVSTPVELFSVRLKALTAGSFLVRLRPGTIGADESPDFLVLPSVDDLPWSGADYTAGTVTIEVIEVGGASPPVLKVERAANGGLRVTVEGIPGRSVALEETENLGNDRNWRRVGQSPAGSAALVFETVPGGPSRYFRGVTLTGDPG